MAMVEARKRATSDPALRKEVLKRIADERVEFVLLWFTDIEGHLKSFAITPTEIADALDDGMGFDGSSITGPSGSGDSSSDRDWNRRIWADVGLLSPSRLKGWTQVAAAWPSSGRSPPAGSKLWLHRAS